MSSVSTCMEAGPVETSGRFTNPAGVRDLRRGLICVGWDLSREGSRAPLSLPSPAASCWRPDAPQTAASAGRVTPRRLLLCGALPRRRHLSGRTAHGPQAPGLPRAPGVLQGLPRPGPLQVRGNLLLTGRRGAPAAVSPDLRACPPGQSTAGRGPELRSRRRAHSAPICREAAAARTDARTADRGWRAPKP